jgi:hypothetical protein
LPYIYSRKGEVDFGDPGVGCRLEPRCGVRSDL